MPFFIFRSPEFFSFCRPSDAAAGGAVFIGLAGLTKGWRISFYVFWPREAQKEEIWSERFRRNFHSACPKNGQSAWELEQRLWGLELCWDVTLRGLHQVPPGGTCEAQGHCLDSSWKRELFLVNLIDLLFAFGGLFVDTTTLARKIGRRRPEMNGGFDGRNGRNENPPGGSGWDDLCFIRPNQVTDGDGNWNGRFGVSLFQVLERGQKRVPPGGLDDV